MDKKQVELQRQRLTWSVNVAEKGIRRRMHLSLLWQIGSSFELPPQGYCGMSRSLKSAPTCSAYRKEGRGLVHK